MFNYIPSAVLLAGFIYPPLIRRYVNDGHENHVHTLTLGDSKKGLSPTAS